MKILVINLDAAKERLDFQNRQMAALGLDFERLTAIAVADLDPSEAARMAGEWERPMRQVEVACLMSHRAAWRRVAGAGAPALILEDDAILCDRIGDVLTALSDLEGLDHVTLEVCGRRKLLANGSRQLTGHTTLTRLVQDRNGAGAYVLWPAGARKLLDRSDRAAGLADAVINSAYELASYQVEPACALQLLLCDAYGVTGYPSSPSTIDQGDADKPAPGSIAAAVRFKARRLAAQARIAWRQLSHIGRARRRFVRLERDWFRSQLIH